ncbi:MAG: ABC transporter permease [Roseiflexaceae bacterium]|nr:ABC transporter permease [Chloroflexaceae bacterium]
MKLRLILRRVAFLIMVVWAASTITFFIPRMSDRNPIRERFAELARTGGFSASDLEVIVASYNKKFGLDKPLWEQYVDYIGSIARLDLGVSLNRFPKTVTDIIYESLPWTIVLLFVSAILSFVIGNLLGAIAAWPKSPAWMRSVATPFIMFMGVPPVLLAIFLLFFLAFRLKLFPLGQAYSTGIAPDWSFSFILNVAWHQVLPAVSMILGSVGGWVLSMRGMGVTIQGEDYVNFAEHKGLNGRTIFRDYYLRNALLPQVTGFALALGSLITSGAVVESLYALPGLGSKLSQAIQANDFLVIYGIVLFITMSVATLMVLVEFLYPLLDPRIKQD